jgi:hypothetical protein
MKQVRIHNTFFDAGQPKYLAGELYPVTEDTLRQVARGNGEEVDVPAPAETLLKTWDDVAAQAVAETEANERAVAEAQAAADAAAAQQLAATGDAGPAAAPAPAPAPAAPTPARKRAGS